MSRILDPLPLSEPNPHYVLPFLQSDFGYLLSQSICHMYLPCDMNYGGSTETKQKYLSTNVVVSHTIYESRACAQAK